jgi:predicted transcriptional regulator
MNPNIALLSIQHKYSDMIFKGTKIVELRRVRPRSLNQGDFIIVYATSPQKEIVGLLEVAYILESSPIELWEVVKGKAGIDRKGFFDYFSGSPVAFAIFIKKAHRFKTPLGLGYLRERWEDFHPPQCYKYLSSKELKMFEDIACFNILDFSDKAIEYFQPEIPALV